MLEVAKFGYHLLDWNLGFKTGRFSAVFFCLLCELLELIPGIYPLWLKLGSQIVPQTGSTKVEKNSGPPMEGQLFFSLTRDPLKDL